MNLQQYFLSNGQENSTTKRNTILLDSKQIWLVLAGRVDIFAVDGQHSSPTSRRHYLMSVEEGGLVFGFPLKNKERFSLVGINSLGAKVVALDETQFWPSIANYLEKHQLSTLIDNWIMGLHAAMSHKHTAPTMANYIEDAQGENDSTFETLLLEALLSTRQGIAWCQIASSTTVFLNGIWPYNNSNSYLPLSKTVWLETTETVKYHSCSTIQLLEKGVLRQCLNEFNALAFQVAQHNYQQVIEQEGKHYQARLQQSRNMMTKAIKGLVDPQSGLDIIKQGADSSLLSASQAIARASGIDINLQQQPLKTDNVADIAQAYHFKYRRVALRANWWLKDNGPLLGYLEEGNQPVALLPDSPGSYFCLNPQTGMKNKINEDRAQQVKPFAVQFYRSFPDKPLTPKDILKFGLQGIWRRDLFALVIFGILSGLASMILPLSVSMVYNNVIPTGAYQSLWFVGLFLVSGALAGLLFQLVRSFSLLRLNASIDYLISAAFWDRVLSLPATFFKQFSAGELSMKVFSFAQLQDALISILVTGVLGVLLAVPNIVLLFYFSSQLALRAMLMILLLVLSMALLLRRQVKQLDNSISLANTVNGKVLELIKGISKIRMANAQSRAYTVWAKPFSKYRLYAQKAGRTSNMQETIAVVIPLLATIVVFVQVLNYPSNIEIGTFAAFISAYASVMAAFTMLMGCGEQIASALANYANAKPILKSVPEYSQAKGAVTNMAGQIEVSQVSFSYPGNGRPVLEDITLSIKPGEYVAVVGPSGSGKSTLLRLLLGFEQPQLGGIYYDGQNLAELDVQSLRKQMGVVLQDSNVMTGDIKSNILGSNVNLTLEDAWRAAQQAGLADDIKKMPMGMHTLVSENGSTFSGGQKQRLMIARAIVNMPKVLFFDEATSALDNKTQAIVSQSLDKLNATRLVIAHRLSTIVNCDRIIVLDKGKVVEDGTYEQLVKNNGLFAELAKRQLA